MDFSKALEAMKEDNKVRLPELPDGWYIVIGDVAWGNTVIYQTFMLVKGNTKNSEPLKLIPRILLSMDWEIIEDTSNISDAINYYKKWLESMINKLDCEIHDCVKYKYYQRAGTADSNKECFELCLKVLTQLEHGEDISGMNNSN